ncbi:MAG: methyltransferase [Bacteroidales bacterium]|nr:methyltransferase [Bacteroidales bacterium]
MLQSLIKNRSIRSSKVICYFLFGFYPLPKNRKTLWDSTSLLFRRALIKWAKNHNEVLEIGTGDVGLLSNFLARKRKVNITAIDICNEFILNSNKNNSGITFLKSNLYSALDKSNKYDIIFSNPPYVKTSQINAHNHMKYHGFVKEDMLFYASDGGDNGIQFISKIINESASFLKRDGSLLLGFNQNHIDNDLLNEIIKNSKLYQFSQIRSKYSSCIVINLKLKDDE